MGGALAAIPLVGSLFSGFMGNKGEDVQSYTPATTDLPISNPTPETQPAVLGDVAGKPQNQLGKNQVTINRNTNRNLGTGLGSALSIGGSGAVVPRG